MLHNLFQKCIYTSCTQILQEFASPWCIFQTIPRQIKYCSLVMKHDFPSSQLVLQLRVCISIFLECNQIKQVKLLYTVCKILVSATGGKLSY